MFLTDNKDSDTVKRKKEESRFWSKISNSYDDWIEQGFKEQYKVFKSKIASYIQSGDSVLEIGTGTGEIAFYIAPKCKNVTGTDISPEMIDIARKKNTESGYKNLSFQVEDAYNLSFDKNEFTKIVSCNVLQTMKNPYKSIQECGTILDKGNEYLSITYCFGNSNLFEQAKLIKWVILYGKPKYWNNFKSDELINLFQEAGFEIIEKEWVWDKPAVLFLRSRKM
ncbi:class I SAM-dependent methyltransferase [Methanohalobium sp.]|uniref:class I SAM-dependent methyltransferase n=1 Tax=Methanohalobium sp. TaxID=2837493 RepID=UPI0025EEC042|nr:class I SAM-dependent methyltransferase [Methanohalobium sp.]